MAPSALKLLDLGLLQPELPQDHATVFAGPHRGRGELGRRPREPGEQEQARAFRPCREHAPSAQVQ